MSMSIGKPRGCMADINVTPMADVMIVLLIIFMVATPMIAEDRVRLPPAAHCREKEKSSQALVFELRDDGSLFVEARSLGTVTGSLAPVAELVQADPSRPIQVKADRNVPYTWVQSLLAACREGGGETISLSTARRQVQ